MSKNILFKKGRFVTTVLCLMLVAVLVVSFASCGESSGTDSSSADVSSDVSLTVSGDNADSEKLPKLSLHKDVEFSADKDGKPVVITETFEVGHTYLLVIDGDTHKLNGDKPAGLTKKDSSWEVYITPEKKGEVLIYGTLTTTENTGNIALSVKNTNNKTYKVSVDLYDISDFDMKLTDIVEKLKIKSSLKSKWDGKNVLVLGDSLTSAGVWQTELETQLGMNVTTHALGGSQLMSIIDGWTHGNGTVLPPLTAEDVEQQDIIVLFAGYNDRLLSTIGNVDDEYDKDKLVTGQSIAAKLNYCIDTLKLILNNVGNTNCKILVVTPHYYGNSGGDTLIPSADNENILRQELNNGSTGGMKDFCDMMVSVANKKGVEVFNAYDATYADAHNTDNFKDKYEYWNKYQAQVADAYGYIPGTTKYADQLHMNDEGYHYLGKKIAEKVNTLEP